MLCDEIPGRSWLFAPYGLVFTKEWARGYSFNPVWYLNTMRGQTWLTTPLNELAEMAHSGMAFTKGDDGTWKKALFRDSQIAKLLPFIETAGVGKDFSWEREWRRVGSLPFTVGSTVAVLAPESDHAAFQTDYEQQCDDSGWPSTTLNLVDPNWPVDRIRDAVMGAGSGVD